MKRFLFTFLALALVLPVMAEDVEITFDKLPEKARKVVLKAYPDTKIKKVEMERRASLIQYEVKLQGGIKMQFSKDGTFTECECTEGSVPSVLIPEKIQEYMAKEFPNMEIRSFEHDSKLYELLLDNGYELSFNSSYRLIDIDRPVE